MDCIFCKILEGEIPSKKVYEDDFVLGFYDIEPQAPVHIVLIPKVHIESPEDINSENSLYAARIFEAAAKIAKQLELKKGYRLCANCKQEGGQTVNHLHVHMLAGRNLSWPPG